MCAAGFPINGGDTNVTHTGNPRIDKNPIQAENGTLEEEDGLVRTPTHGARTLSVLRLRKTTRKVVQSNYR